MRAADLIEAIDRSRRDRGLLDVSELLALAALGTVVLDPLSTLITRGVLIGRDNIIEPNVLLLSAPGGTLTIGDGNRFHPGTRIEAAGGNIRIGSRNAFGPGGFTASSNAESEISIGDDGRYTLNCAVTGNSTLGSGSQILGPIAVDACVLGAGGSHREAAPDTRGAVLKGTGRARGLNLAQGQVIQGFGLFDRADAKMQSHFHPSKAEQV
jgi:bifunctional N-acetylglucosamine-1-phosphate-uridyltransferase/glucosamine-1-phosphate-acetyltransferase GlmU-like protein